MEDDTITFSVDSSNEDGNDDTNILSIQDNLLNNSRIAPTGNGNKDHLINKSYSTQPTGGQKWWAAVLLGFLFALISSPSAYQITSQITSTLGSAHVTDSHSYNIMGLVIHTVIFIIIIRIILW